MNRLEEQAAAVDAAGRRSRRRSSPIAAGGLLLLCLLASAALLLPSSDDDDDHDAPSSLPNNAVNDDDGDLTASISDTILLRAAIPPGRSLSISLPDGGCQVTHAISSPVPIKPTWQASFPGSGARMTWSLVEALTGIRTNNDYDSAGRGYESVVAVKTHYPVKNARNRFDKLDPLFDRAMVVFRNPLHAIPSYFNLQYEHENNLPNHSTRGPTEDWIAYRDSSYRGVTIQLDNYERFVSYWMERYPDRVNQLHVASYEELTNSETGPGEAVRIAEFLGREEGVYPVDRESVPCVWETMVNYRSKSAPPPPLPPKKPLGLLGKVMRNKERRKRRTMKELAENAELRENLEGKGRIQQKRIWKRHYKLKQKQRTMNQELFAGDSQRELFVGHAQRRKLFTITRLHGNSLRGGLPTVPRPSADALRAGPTVRPYTGVQLGEMALMLRRLLERYGDADEEFRRIFTSYVFEVETTKPDFE